MDDQRTNRASGGIRFRKLRIAWSVAWGLAAVLLIVLLVRSYRAGDSTRADGDYVSYEDSRMYLYTIDSTKGNIHLSLCASKPPWQIRFDHTKHFGFGLSSWDASTTISFPYWFPVLISTAFAALPWLPWRFSLRTLLIATTLVAVVLGAIVWSVR